MNITIGRWRLYIDLHRVHDVALADRILRAVWASPLPHGEEPPTFGTVVLWLEAPRQLCEEMQAALLEMGLLPSMLTIRRAPALLRPASRRTRGGL